MTDEVKSIEELRKEYDQLRTYKIQVGTQLDNAQKQLDELKEKARDEFGTDDVGELKQKLEQMKAENLAKRTEYQQTLDGIQQQLEEIEKQYQSGP